MIKESNVLKRVKEDILRILGERKEKVSLKSMKAEINVSLTFMSEAIKTLEEEGLISVEKEFIRLTKNGLAEAKDIVKKHLVLENYFKETRSEREADQVAELLELYVSEEVIYNIEKLFTLKKEGVPLTEFGFNKEGLITDMITSDSKLFERMVSIGILPGEVIEVTNKIFSGVVVKINNKKIVLDKTIAKEIKVFEYEKS
ncbi:MAG: metal-dependent transcriptional regulator [Candidatus Wukongarchaeota archaeon]|nr:FeoA domain-containing protein [Candidatus Wukongarchaeota archaeon]